jgi:hypothetical protein
MEPIFDRTGATVAWRRRDAIYDLQGKGIGFVHQRALFTRDGRYVGRFEDDLYRDTRGRVIAFEREATGGPLLPVPGPLPVAPQAEVRPPQPQFEPAPRPAMRSMAWSDLQWDDLFAPAATRAGA